MKIRKLFFKSLACLLSICVCALPIKAEIYSTDEAKNKILSFCNQESPYYFEKRSAVFYKVFSSLINGEYSFVLREDSLLGEVYHHRDLLELKDAVVRALINTISELPAGYNVFNLRGYETFFIAQANNYAELLVNLNSLIEAYDELECEKRELQKRNLESALFGRRF